MLIQENFIREDKVKQGKTTYRLHIYRCLSCSSEVKSRTAYLNKHSGLCKSCSCKITIKQVQDHNRLRPYEAKYNIFKHKCPETNLTYEDYLTFVNTNCHYCECKLPWIPFGENNPGFWLDRKDNSIGHLKGNLVTCCGLCNKTRRDAFTYEEFLLFKPILKQILKQRSLD